MTAMRGLKAAALRHCENRDERPARDAVRKPCKPVPARPA